MNGASQNSGNDVELVYFLERISKFFKKIIVFFISYFNFLKRNILQILVVLIFSVGIGKLVDVYFFDKESHSILVIPNFESSNMLYDRIKNFKSDLNHDDFLKKKILDVEIVSESNLYDLLNSDDNHLKVFDVISKSNAFDVEKFEKKKDLAKNFKYQLLEINTKSISNDSANILLDRYLSLLNDDVYYNSIKEVEVKNLVLKRKELLKTIDHINLFFENIGNKQGESGMVSLNSFDQINDMLITKERFLKELSKIDTELIEQKNVIYEVYRITNIKNKSNKFIVIVPIIFLLTFSIFKFKLK